MTTCVQCLNELSTMRMADVGTRSPVAIHCESCPSCADVMQGVAYAERRLSTALSEARSAFTSDELSQNAMSRSEFLRRKVVGRWVRGLLAACASVIFWFFIERVVMPQVEPRQVVRESIFLNCITPEQALEIATPYLRSSGSSIYKAGSEAITLSGQPAEFAAAVNHIKVVDDKQKCQLSRGESRPLVHVYKEPPTTSAPATTSNDKPGKD